MRKWHLPTNYKFSRKALGITVEDIMGKQHSIKVKSSWTYAQLHNEFLQMFGNQGELVVIFGERYLSVSTHGADTLKQLGLTNNCVIRVLQVPNFIIIVEDKEGQHQTLQVNGLWSYAQLHNQFVQIFGNKGELTVIFGNNNLSVGEHGTATLKELKFIDNCIIRVLQCQKLVIIAEDSTGQQQKMQVNSSWTYAQLHKEFARWFGNGDELSVIFRNKYLSVDIQGNATLEQLRFTNNCIIKILEKVKGGI